MTIATDQSVYYRFLTDPQIVTVRTNRRLTAETFDEISWLDGTTKKGGADKATLSRLRSAFGGVIQLTGDEQGWNIPNDLLVNADGLQAGDLIIESEEDAIDNESVTWVIRNVIRESFGNQWICSCTKGRLE